MHNYVYDHTKLWLLSSKQLFLLSVVMYVCIFYGYVQLEHLVSDGTDWVAIHWPQLMTLMFASGTAE